MRPVDYAALTERRCCVCKTVKPIAEFNRYTDASAILTGWRYYSRCIPCNRSQCKDYGQANRPKRNARLTNWRAANPETASRADRRKALRSKYGLTVAQADMLLAANGGRCWICNDAASDGIDHDHSTGKVRGALCRSCNTFLGRIEANPQILPGMSDYLELPCHADVLLALANPGRGQP